MRRREKRRRGRRGKRRKIDRQMREKLITADASELENKANRL